MKNILNIKVNTICNCSCFENINDGTNQILIIYTCSHPINPRIEINGVEYPVTFNNGIGKYILSFINGETKFRFLDDKYEGTFFTITCENLSLNKSIKLIRINDYEYKAIYEKDELTEEIVNEMINEALEESEKLTSIDVESNNDLVNKVTFNYEKLINGEPIDDPDIPEEEKKTSKSYSIEYDSNENVIKFGEIEVNWL